MTLLGEKVRKIEKKGSSRKKEAHKPSKKIREESVTKRVVRSNLRIENTRREVVGISSHQEEQGKAKTREGKKKTLR